MYIFKECRRRNKLYFLSFQPKSLFPIFFLLHSLGDMVYNIIKLNSNGVASIGNDVRITIVAMITPLVFFTGLVLYFRLIIGFLNGYARMMSKASAEKVRTRFAFLSFLSLFIPPCSLAICLIQCIGLLFPDYENKFGMLYNIGVGILFLSYGIIFNHSVGFLLGELSVYIKNVSNVSSNDIVVVYKRLRLVLMVGWVVFISGFIVSIIVGTSEFLLKRSVYLGIVMQIIMSPTTTVMIMTVSTISRRESVNQINPDKSSLDSMGQKSPSKNGSFFSGQKSTSKKGSFSTGPKNPSMLRNSFTNLEPIKVIENQVSPV
jgi:hypothetical protein